MKILNIAVIVLFILLLLDLVVRLVLPADRKKIKAGWLAPFAVTFMLLSQLINRMDAAIVPESVKMAALIVALVVGCAYVYGTVNRYANAKSAEKRGNSGDNLKSD